MCDGGGGGGGGCDGTPIRTSNVKQSSSSLVIDFGLNRDNIDGMECNGQELKNNFVITYNV